MGYSCYLVLSQAGATPRLVKAAAFDAGDTHGAIALYKHFIRTLHEHELTPIRYLSVSTLVPDPDHPGTEMLGWVPVRAHHERCSLA